jgi:hypothetical protein
VIVSGLPGGPFDGPALSPGPVIVNVCEPETQNPATAPTQGAGVATVTAAVPPLAMSAAEIAAVSDVLDPNVVTRALPLIRTTDVGPKF